jgi:hypothetical protein
MFIAQVNVNSAKLRRSGMLMSPLTGLGILSRLRGYKHSAPPGLPRSLLTAYYHLPTAY